MNPKATWTWVTLAAALFCFIFFFERKWQGGSLAPTGPQKLLAGYRPGTVTALRIRRGTQVVHLDKTGETWRVVSPITYPAQPVVVDTLLKQLDELDRQNRIDSGRLADFGLAEPAAVVLLQQGESQTELQVGGLTTDGEAVYVRVVGVEGIYTAPAALLHKLPATLNDWRSMALISSEQAFSFDRFEVRTAARNQGFALSYNSTNKVWSLARPLLARADRPKVEQLLLRTLSARVTQFVSDNPKTDPEPFGLQPPELELALGSGTNDLLVVQFGKSPTNDPTQVFARRLSQSNVVLVPKLLADSLRAPYADFRERRLLAFPPALITQLEVRGGEPFTLQRQAAGNWRVVEPQDYAADPVLIREFLGDLLAIEASEFEKDVVTDFSTYGLDTPLRQVLLKTTLTNGTTLTNLVVAQVDFGTNSAGRLFAHRPDENSVYGLREQDLLRLPVAAWQLRDRQIWGHSVTNVLRVTISQDGRKHQLIRNGTGKWTFGPASQGMMNEASLERTVARLVTLQAGYWAARGAASRSRYGFVTDGPRIDIEIKGGDQVQTLTLELGGAAQNLAPFAAVNLDGQPWIFELPWLTYQDILRDLSLPKTPGTLNP